MKVLIFGGAGMLGHKLVQVLSGKFEVFTTVHSDLSTIGKYKLIDPKRIFDDIDIEKFENIEKIIKKTEPDFIVNGVGIIKQLPSAKDVSKTLSINAIYPQRLARIAQKYGFRLISISTDCVFSGKKGKYVEEDISDAEDIYGQSKFLGEVIGKNCLTLRTSIIGRELSSVNSLIEWFFSKTGGKVKGYKNAVFTGFPTIVFAEIIADIINNYPETEGLYHVSSEPISKYDLLVLLKEKFKLNIEIEPFEDYYIDRSLDSTKFRKLHGFEPLSWDKMIQKMADDPTPYEEWRKQKF